MSGTNPKGIANIAWKTATALAVAAIVFLSIRIHQLSISLSDLNFVTQAQIAKLTEQLAQSQDANHRASQSAARRAQDSAAPVKEQPRAEARQTASSLPHSLREQQSIGQADRQMLSQFNAPKRASARSKPNRITGGASSLAELQQTGSDLRRVNGDMGVMSGLIATNSRELAQLRELGERDYFAFDLKRDGGMQKLGTIEVSLDQVDPKRNCFTLEVLADDKRVEKTDRSINEPLQFYVSGNRQPYEIVVNEVKNDEVVGYLAVPKLRIARR